MIAIIPAKKNSSRLRNKNIKLLKKKPLLFYSIKAPQNSRFVKRIFVLANDILGFTVIDFLKRKLKYSWNYYPPPQKKEAL